MTNERRNAMTELLARVEAGDLRTEGGVIGPEEDGLVWAVAGDSSQRWSDVVSAYDGDLNDALAMLEWLLPGAWMLLSGETDGPFSAVVHDGIADEVDYISDVSFARALLIATLKAKLGTTE